MICSDMLIPSPLRSAELQSVQRCHLGHEDIRYELSHFEPSWRDSRAGMTSAQNPTHPLRHCVMMENSEIPTKGEGSGRGGGSLSSCNKTRVYIQKVGTLQYLYPFSGAYYILILGIHSTKKSDFPEVL